MKQEWFHYDTLKQDLPPLSETANRVSADIAYSGMFMDSINPTGLFLARFHRIPNMAHEKRINCTKAFAWLRENYGHELKDLHYSKLVRGNHQRNRKLEDIFVYLFEDLLIWFDFSGDEIRFLFRDTSPGRVEEMVKGVKKFRKRRPANKGRIFVMVSSSDSLDLKELTTSKPRMSIRDNYNDDFQDIHRTILKRLAQSGKGLVILHGKPGTGKTFYIRYLAAMVRKRVIFLPPGMAGAITNPGLIELLIDHPNSILVIEDAEQLIMSRESNRESPVSAILNITDGLLSDCLNIQVVCSFNTDISRIDPALLRKGRLIARYEFRELTTDKARCLSARLGYTEDIPSPKTLAAVYNPYERDDLPAIRPKIGFAAE
jgi:hypothetical protein